MKLNKKVVIAATVVLFSFVLITPESKEDEANSKGDGVSSVEQDLVYGLLVDIASKIGVEIYEIKETEVTWTANTVDLALNKGKTLYIRESFNWEDAENYFKNNDWKMESMGWTYVSEDGSNSVGYMPSEMSHKFKGGMCILKMDESEIQCGLGPSAD